MKNLFYSLALFVLSLLATPLVHAAKPGCNDQQLHEVTMSDGSIAFGKICWKDQYYVIGYGIERDTITRVVDPHMVVGQIQGGSFQEVDTYRLSHSFGELWCPHVGFKFTIGKEEGVRLFSLKVVRPTTYNRSGVLKLHIHKPKENNYIDQLYCGDIYKDLVGLRIRQLNELYKTPIMTLVRNRPDPIRLWRQK